VEKQIDRQTNKRRKRNNYFLTV